MGISITNRPDKEIDTGYNSRWLAINGGYPVFFTLYRKDFAVSEILDDGNGFTQINVTGDITSELTEGQSIFFSSASMGDYSAIITAATYTTETEIVTDHVFTAAATDTDAANYINLIGARDDYKMRLQIYGTTTNALLFEGKYGPSPDGKVDFDVAGAIIPHVSNEMDETYAGIREADTNTTQPFYIKYAEYYNTIQFSGTVDPYFYRGVNCANQLRDSYGENMGERVAFNADVTPKAKWLTDFDRPKFWNNYPFDLTAIIETNGVEPSISRHEESFDALDVSQATNSATYPAGSDFSYPQRNATYLNTYADSICSVDIWLETDGAGDICTTLATYSQAQKWNFQQAQVDSGTGELLAIYIEANPLSGISSIDTHPQMTVTDGTNVWLYQWNATQGYYDAVAGPNYVTQYTNYTFSIASLDVTIYGQTCTTSFEQSYVFTASLFAPPVASAGAMVAENSAFKNGNTVTVSYTYNDDENSPQDLSATIVELWYFDTVLGAGGAKIADLTHESGSDTDNGVRTMDPYIIPSAAINKYIGVKITPVATVVPTTGVEYIYVNSTLVVTNTAAVVLPTDNTDPTDFEFFVSIESGKPYYLEFSDGSTPEYYVGSGSLGGHIHGFSGVSTPHTLTVCCDPDDVLGLTASAMNLNGTVDLSQCDELNGILDLSDNALLTLVTLPSTGTPILNDIDLNDTGITAFDLGTVTGNNDLFLRRCYDLATFTPNNTVIDNGYDAVRIDLTDVAALDLSKFNSARTIAVPNNYLLTSLTMPDASTVVINNLQINNNVILASAVDLSGCDEGFKTTFHAYNSNITSFTFPAKSVFDGLVTAGDYITDFRVHDNNLSSPNFSSVTNLSAVVRAFDDTMTAITFATSNYDGTFTEIDISNAGISGTLDISKFTEWDSGGKIDVSSNASLSTLTTPTMASGNIDDLNLSSCNFTTEANMNLANLTLATASVSFNFSFNGLSAAEVDNVLATLDSALGSGTGTINITNTTPPTATGDASAASLAGKGYTVLTD